MPDCPVGDGDCARRCLVVQRDSACGAAGDAFVGFCCDQRIACIVVSDGDADGLACLVGCSNQRIGHGQGGGIGTHVGPASSVVADLPLVVLGTHTIVVKQVGGIRRQDLPLSDGASDLHDVQRGVNGCWCIVNVGDRDFVDVQDRGTICVSHRDADVVGADVCIDIGFAPESQRRTRYTIGIDHCFRCAGIEMQPRGQSTAIGTRCGVHQPTFYVAEDPGSYACRQGVAEVFTFGGDLVRDGTNQHRQIIGALNGHHHVLVGMSPFVIGHAHGVGLGNLLALTQRLGC